MLIRRIMAIAPIIMLGVASHVDARQVSAANARKSIQSLYNIRDAGAEKKDVNTALSSLAPDFIFVSKDGQTGDAKLLKRRLTPLFTLMQAVKSKSDIQQFALQGNQAMATVKQHLEMMVVNPQTQVPQKFIADSTSEDIWAKTSSGWLQKRMTTTAEKAVLIQQMPLQGTSSSQSANAGGVDVDDEINKISHGTGVLSLPPTSETPLEGNLWNGVGVNNNTPYQLKLFYSGPTKVSIIVRAGESVNIDIPPGTYRIGVRVMGGNVKGLYGHDTFRAGIRSTITYFIKRR